MSYKNRHYRKPAPRGVRTDTALGLGYRARQSGRITPAQVQKLFAPAKTLGAPRDAQLASDAALKDAGVYNLIQHGIELGQMPLTSFMGYAALQQIQQNALLRAIIETPVRDMLQQGFKLSVDRRESEKSPLDEFFEEYDPKTIDEEDVNAIAVIERKYEEHGLNKKLKQCLTLDASEGGAFLFIDTGAQGDDLQLPLEISRHSAELSPDRPLKFKVIDPINVFPGVYNASDPLQDYYFDPQTWWILGTQVHGSRLIKFVSNEAPLLLKPAYNFLGIPRAQMLWDYVIHWNENRSSANRLLNKFSLLAFKTNMEDVLGGALADNLDRRMDYLAQKRTNDGVVLMDKESEDLINVATPISGVTDIVKQSLEACAVIAHIPAVVLFGQSPQGFNATGESDIKNYATLIESMRRDLLLSPLQAIVEILKIHDTALDKRIKVDFVPFNDTQSNSDAQTAFTLAQTAAARIQAGITSAEEERQRLQSDPNSGLQFLDVETEPPAANLPDDFIDEVMNGNQNKTGPGASGGDPEPGRGSEPQEGEP